VFVLGARLLAGLSALVVLLALAGTARAEPFNPTLEAEYDAALAFWGVSAPPQCEEVRKAILPTDPWSTVAGEGGAAAATQPPPGVTYEWCELNVFADKFPTGACLRQEAINHEVGHLLGYGHSEGLTDIMYPSLQASVWCPEEIPPTIIEPTTDCRQTKRHPQGLCLPAGSFPPEKHHHRKGRGHGESRPRQLALGARHPGHRAWRLGQVGLDELLQTDRHSSLG
jgi:hypothetical protein